MPEHFKGPVCQLLPIPGLMLTQRSLQPGSRGPAPPCDAMGQELTLVPSLIAHPGSNPSYSSPAPLTGVSKGGSLGPWCPAWCPLPPSTGPNVCIHITQTIVSASCGLPPGTKCRVGGEGSASPCPCVAAWPCVLSWLLSVVPATLALGPAGAVAGPCAGCGATGHQMSAPSSAHCLSEM